MIALVLIHTVTPGETLFTIAARYGVTVASLIEANRPPNPENLVVGQALIIPTTDLTYAVRQGETLFLIAQVFGLTVSQIAAANNIANPNLIFPGQVLRIPGWEAVVYTVAPGDTLFRIAQFFGIPLDLILRVNIIPDPNAISVGQRIVIPLRSVERRPIATNGFILPASLATARRILAPIGPLLTYVSIFDFPVDGQGGIIVPNFAPSSRPLRNNGSPPWRS